MKNTTLCYIEKDGKYLMLHRIKKENDMDTCQIHVMPPQITDDDITALFNGLLNIVKKKIELDGKSQLLNISSTLKELSAKLKAKEAECVKLKNEVLKLKAQLKT